MGISRYQPETILQILLDRITGVPQVETAKALGYTKTQALSRVVKKFKLDEIEAQIRLSLRLEGNEVPDEVISINEEYEEMLVKTTEALKKTVDNLQHLPADGDDKEKMQALSAMVIAMEKIRTARLNIAQVRSDQSSKNDEDGDASAFEDLVDD